MIAASFRTKLLLTMMAVVAGVTVATLYATQSRIQQTYEHVVNFQIQQQVASFTDAQTVRLRTVKQKCGDLAGSVRLWAALEDGDPDLIYNRELTLFQLRDVLGGPTANEAANQARAGFLFFLDPAGRIIKPPASESALMPPAVLREMTQAAAALRSALTNTASAQQVGYLAPELEAGRPSPHEFVLTPVIRTEPHQIMGALVIGFPLAERPPSESGSDSPLRSGIWLGGEIYSGQIPRDESGLVKQEILRRMESGRLRPEFDFENEESPARVFLRPLNPGSDLPAASQVCLYSLKEMRDEQGRLRSLILGFGGAALLVALVLSLALSHGLSVPVEALARGTAEIQQGNLAVRVPVKSRDEIGRLAASFNEMAEGLALKERYRSVLNMVADKNVAQELIHGQLALGGEKRVVSVLFCDIRGFTTLTQNMDPVEVIQLLNEHMTALTRVVYEQNGVVDKFVGDLIMAFFGAPKSYGDDTGQAARCALRMIEEREKLNRTSRYNIGIGIGLATGPAVVGCMGSSDRLNYTVLGERVNLASRLCGKAGRMEIIIDQTTRERLGDSAQTAFLGELDLKGFSQPAPAHQLTALRSLSPTPA